MFQDDKPTEASTPAAEAAPVRERQKPGPKPKPKVPKKRKKPGRPKVRATKAQRAKVEVLLGGGMAIEEVAACMDLAPKTFRRVFATEILVGRSKCRAEVIAAMHKSAKAGNVAAQKAYLAMNAVAQADEDLRNANKEIVDDIPEPKPVRLGKKEQQAIDAVAAATGAGDDSEGWGNLLDTSVVQ